MVEPVERLGEVLLEGLAQAIGEAGLVVDHTPALLDQMKQRAHRHALRIERSQAVTVVHQQFKCVLGVSRIVLGPAGLECFAVLGQGRRVDRKSTKKSYFCSA